MHLLKFVNLAWASISVSRLAGRHYFMIRWMPYLRCTLLLKRVHRCQVGYVMLAEAIAAFLNVASASKTAEIARQAFTFCWFAKHVKNKVDPCVVLFTCVSTLSQNIVLGAVDACHGSGAPAIF